MGVSVDALELPEGYEAWAVSLRRGIRFRLESGGALPLLPGFTDSLEVRAGPAAAVRASVSAVPEAVAALGFSVVPSPGGFSLRLSIPETGRLAWSLLTLDGRVRARASMSLPEGIYTLPAPDNGNPVLARGMYILAVDWSPSSAKGRQSDSRRRFQRKLAVP